MHARISAGTVGRTLTAVAAALVVASCSDAPTAPADGTVPHASAKPHPGITKPVLHVARVRSDGTMVDGTATAVERLGEGRYRLTFPPPIGHCSAVASSAAFSGFDVSVLRIATQVSIGFGDGGAFDDASVVVNLFVPMDGSSEDSSFSLVLACP